MTFPWLLKVSADRGRGRSVNERDHGDTEQTWNVSADRGRGRSVNDDL